MERLEHGIGMAQGHQRIGPVIRSWRNANRLYQKDIEAGTGIAYRRISHLENEDCYPEAGELASIAKFIAEHDETDVEQTHAALSRCLTESIRFGVKRDAVKGRSKDRKHNLTTLVSPEGQMSFATWFKTWRKVANLRQDQVAAALDSDQYRISRFERGLLLPRDGEATALAKLAFDGVPNLSPGHRAALQRRVRELASTDVVTPTESAPEITEAPELDRPKVALAVEEPPRAPAPPAGDGITLDIGGVSVSGNPADIRKLLGMA